MKKSKSRGSPSTALAKAERVLERTPEKARASLQSLTADHHAPDVRAQAYAGLAILEAGKGQIGFGAAQDHLHRASELKIRGKGAQGRVEHARGYLSFKSGQTEEMIKHLNEAAELYPRSDRRRAHVFDTLGLYFWTNGDLDRAAAYYRLSIESKQGMKDEQYGLAITHGNLGRVELSREGWEVAESEFRRDLQLIEKDGVSPEIVARVRNGLANAIMEQGPKRAAEAEKILREALIGVDPESITHAFLMKDLSRAALRRGMLPQATKYAREAIERSKGKHDEVLAFANWALGSCILRSGELDAEAERAFQAFDHALNAFRKARMNIEYCQVALDKAELFEKLGLHKQALDVLAEGPESALGKAEQFLFEEANPLQRIEERIGKLNSGVLAQIRQRRMRGGLPEEAHTGRLKQNRERITVWTCDIRGFTAYCDNTENPAEVVRMLNRFFGAIGRMLIERGGIIDKYVGDNILAWFRDARQAALASVDALAIVDAINRQRTHLKDQALDIGIGLATGEAVIGCVGFAGKLEHTIIGTVVNRACRLVGEAKPGVALMDDATKQLIGKGIAVRRFKNHDLVLKGLKQKVRAWEVVRKR